MVHYQLWQAVRQLQVCYQAASISYTDSAIGWHGPGRSLFPSFRIGLENDGADSALGKAWKSLADSGSPISKIRTCHLQMWQGGRNGRRDRSVHIGMWIELGVESLANRVKRKACPAVESDYDENRHVFIRTGLFFLDEDRRFYDFLKPPSDCINSCKGRCMPETFSASFGIFNNMRPWGCQLSTYSANYQTNHQSGTSDPHTHLTYVDICNLNLLSFFPSFFSLLPS